MSVTHGQRRDVVIEVSEALVDHADRLHGIATDADHCVRTLDTAWEGADAERLIEQWNSSRRDIDEATQRIRTMSSILREQAQQQEQASSVAGLSSPGGGPSGPGGGSSDSTSGSGISDRIGGSQPQPIDKDIWKLAWHVYGDDNERYHQPPDNIGQPPLPEGWSEVSDAELEALGLDPADFHHQDGSGMEAALYRQEDGSYVLAYRGSDNTIDWPNNFAQGLGLTGDVGAAIGRGLDVGATALGAVFGAPEAGAQLGDFLGRTVTNSTSQYDQAMALAIAVEGAVGDGNVVMTGHSLGGGLAAAAGMATGATAITFDAAGVHPNTAALAAEMRGGGATAASVTADAEGANRAYRISDDILTSVQEHWGTAPLAYDAPGTAIDLAPVQNEMRSDWQEQVGGWGANVASVPIVGPTAIGVGSLLTGQGAAEAAGDFFNAFTNPVEEGNELGSQIGGSAYGHHWTPMDQRMEEMFPD